MGQTLALPANARLARMDVIPTWQTTAIGRRDKKWSMILGLHDRWASIAARMSGF
jgi:hypothetical protein